MPCNDTNFIAVNILLTKKKSLKKTLSEEGEKSEVNLKTNGGLGCSQEQEDSVVEFKISTM